MISRSLFVTYEDVREVKPVLTQVRKEGPTKEIRASASRILKEIENVRSDVDYEPLPGYQVILEDRDYQVLKRLVENQ